MIRSIGRFGSVRRHFARFWYSGVRIRCSGTTSYSLPIAVVGLLPVGVAFAQHAGPAHSSVRTETETTDKWLAAPELDNVRPEGVGWWELALRGCYVLLGLTPLIFSAPFAWALSYAFPEVSDRWWDWALLLAGSQGPIFVKLLQWAAMRVDLFPAFLCRRLSNLHFNAPQHEWHETATALADAFGPDWNTHVLSLEKKPLGSGCIAQVYEGETIGKDPKRVAVKVVHPAVRRRAEVDVELLRYCAALIDQLPMIRDVLNAAECVDEFASRVQPQLDMRAEALNLLKFRANFLGNGRISFPQPIEALTSESILVEEFEDGQPVLNEPDDSHRRQLARLGVGAFLEMVFNHHFVHGDLHPGNVLVTSGGDSLVLLDAGIAFSIEPKQIRDMRDLFQAIARGVCATNPSRASFMRY
uniref:Protein kinase domain-containing protein n=1 Tax=Rhodosorus marinus TaxID=101924 RepID=A0A7S2ZT15_9RHOD|mmetsp:Transcript_31637/g.122467  ORF Transcript_31637/g.122467 Transcript_31637/m.122467 type:complete len:414 (+) Transcript_31637:232-1473(+)